MPRWSKARKAAWTAVVKDSIIEATTSVLTAHGVNGTTMNRVAEAADLAKSSLYDHFRNKEELLAFVAERIMAPAAERMEEIVRADLSAVEKFRGMIRAALSSVEQHRALLVWLVRDKHRHGPAGQSIRERVVERMAAVFEQGMREGDVRPGDPQQLARLFMACLAEFCELWVATEPPEEIDRCVALLMELFLHGVSARMQPSAGRSCDR
jgi:AcrR family transcriptional regulator